MSEREVEEVEKVGEVGESTENGNYTVLNITKKSTSVHERKKTVAEGLLDIGLLVANASQLKSLFDRGVSYQYFHILLVLLILTFLVQITVGFLLLALANIEEAIEDKKRYNRLNNAIMALVFIAVVINVMVSVFGISS
ncbi:ninjurin-2-like [Saccostrea cucullata]|uniref:ninjurin-2-like n=1 Tax=Saccostrea cuccullata TaxID=36930 RepID=UPI002ED1FE63